MKEAKKELATPSERLVYLLDKLWRGNRSAMAADCGCSQGAISHVATGRRQVGQRLLSLVAADSRVNGSWLLTGEGQPLLTMTFADRQACRLLISEQLLPTLNDQVRALLSGESVDVAEGAASPTRYAFRIPAGHAVLTADDAALHCGDLLVIETATTDLVSQLELLDGRLVVVKSGSITSPNLEIARTELAHEEGSAPMFARSLHREVAFEFKSRSTAGLAESVGRAIRFDDGGGQTPQDDISIRLSFKAIVGIIVLLMRMSP
jgi:hypothetical protein